MPTLNWIGKEAVIKHDKEVPFKLLKPIKKLSVGNNSQNLVIEGDNLEALKALMPYYYNRIKCIYIDPPYNTGNEKWVYNDKVNSPRIRKWLGQVVGGHTQDLCRHDKWLCMMYPRLKLLKELLSEDGVIFISINDTEVNSLKFVLNEIFGENNFISQIVWFNREGGGSSDSKHFKIKHEYILCYSKNKEFASIKGVKIEDEDRYRLKDKHFKERGTHQLVKLNSASIQYSKSLDYPIEAPDGTKIFPSYGKKRACWRWSKQKLKWGIENDFIVIKKDSKGNWAVYTKQYLKVDTSNNFIQRTNRPFAVIDKFSSTMATKDLEKLFNKKVFEYSKPYLMLKYLFQISTEKDDIILDSFAGSGTTGHAVIDLNKEDSGRRKYILVELESHVAKEITVERIKRAIKTHGYKEGFEYCKLDKPLFDKDGEIEVECTFEQLARYIYFTETKTNLHKNGIKGHFLGKHNEVEYYLIFREKYKNVLNRAFLKKLNKNSHMKVIYADQCLIDNEILKKHNIVFKQIPYEVKVY